MRMNCIAEGLERPKTVPSLILASSDKMKSEGWQMKQCLKVVTNEKGEAVGDVLSIIC
jgi:hypothetical protein